YSGGATGGHLGSADDHAHRPFHGAAVERDFVVRRERHHILDVSCRWTAGRRCPLHACEFAAVIHCPGAFLPGGSSLGSEHRRAAIAYAEGLSHYLAPRVSGVDAHRGPVPDFSFAALAAISFVGNS